MRISLALTAAVLGVLRLANASAATIPVPEGEKEGSGAQASSSSAESAQGLQEIIVTATRASERLSRVAASVTALDQAKLDQEGVRRMEDVARLTPGVTFTDTGYVGQTQISIRGVSSQVGASTTGIYIDDTPVQMRNMGAASTNPYPEVFDLERIEVLRGPQGTLFGAGSEGGAVRFITPTPDLNRYTGYGRAEAGYTEHGAPSWEGGFALGGPIVEDTVGFRASAWYRRTGGYVDRVSNIDGSVTDKDANYRDAYVARLAFKAVPAEWLTITPSVFYQKTKEHDAPLFNQRISDPAEGKFRNPFPQRSPGEDKFVLPALNVQADLGEFTLTSVTSYFKRDIDRIADFSITLPQLLLGPNELAQNLYLSRLPDYRLDSLYPAQQKSFTQELRVQTSNSDARLTGIVGIFVQRTRQHDIQAFIDPMLGDLTQAYFGAPVEAIFGTPMLSATRSYIADDVAHDDQDAVFGELSYRLTDNLKVTAGLRYAKTKFEYDSFQAGPWAGSAGVNAAGTQKEKPLTPKFGVTYSFNDSNLAYATASKGFRTGGVNKPIPLSNDDCRVQLESFGLTQTIGPYDSDSVWSYEIGSKSSGLFDGRLQVFTSAYYLKWKNIQQSLQLPACGYSFTDNLGSAVSAGGDVQFQTQLTDHFQLGGSVAYNDTYYDKTLLGPAGPVVDKGNTVPGAPWTATLSADYTGDVLGKESYARVTYTYRSRNNRDLPEQDPTTLSYDPDAYRLGRTEMVNLRTGVRLSSFDVSLFVNNLMNKHTVLTRTNFAAGLSVFMETTYTPRTIGVTGTYSF